MTLTERDAVQQLTRLVNTDKSLRHAAAGMRLSPAHLSTVISGRRKIGPKILKVLRLRKVVMYEELPIDRLPGRARRDLEDVRRWSR
jgi:hypothetical protein